MSKRLIEEWLPILELGIEGVRERTPMTPFPAPNRLHVWWARRPLVASRAAVLASLLPADADQDKFLHILGIHGDPVAAKRRLDIAKKTGEDLGADPYGYTRAFKYNPTQQEKTWLQAELKKLGIENPVVLDPTAGGGSIPLETSRLGLSVIANDLNPVAVLVQRATYEWPNQFGQAVLDEFVHLSKRFLELAEPKYKSMGIFPEEPPNVQVLGYLWARTITCPYCQGRIPLSPNWRLAPDGTGIRVIPHLGEGVGSLGRVCTFEVVAQEKDHSKGTVKGGTALCPYNDCGRVIDGKVIKALAQAGDMGEQLFAVVYKERVSSYTKTGKAREKWQRGYRAPHPQDDISDKVQKVLDEKLPDWEALNLVPSEALPDNTESWNHGNTPAQYGAKKFQDLFSPRQLLCHGTSIEIYQELLSEAQTHGEFTESTKAAFGYLAASLDTLLNYGSRCGRWDTTTLRVRSMFDRHDFAFIWAYAEMAPLIVGLGYDWALEKTEKCIEELLQLTNSEAPSPNGSLPLFESNSPQPAPITITCQSGDNLHHLSDGSVDAVVIDPPYYDNVMYAELSDFFYVWLKRTAGYLYPELFTQYLTDKDQEAVANPAKFQPQKGAKALAAKDYQERMAAIFAEARRVLTPDGIMTLMFTHKATGAWDALTTGLIEAGFAITASWPINTEASGSLHIKDKSAANSTIFLACRPRQTDPNRPPMYWEDLEPLLAQAIRERIATFQAAGIQGVDLYLSCFGPALEQFSRHWPVKRGQPKLTPTKPKKGADLDPYSVTPEDALEAARREVKRWKLEQLTNTQRIHELDPLTEWFVLAWDAFRAPRFPYDEALRLARVVGLDLDQQVIKTLAEKKASDIILWDSSTRAAKGTLGSPDGRRALIDSLHHAAHLARTQSLTAAHEMLNANQLSRDPRFLASLEALLEVLPPSRAYTGMDPAKAAQTAAADFEALENLRKLAYSDQIDEPAQLLLWQDP